jgi:hypothetical protein
MWAGTRARACILLHAKGEQCAREAINTKNIHLHLRESVCFRMGVVGGGFICRWWCRIRTRRRIPGSLIPLVSLLTAFAPRCSPPERSLVVPVTPLLYVLSYARRRLRVLAGGTRPSRLRECAGSECELASSCANAPRLS